MRAPFYSETLYILMDITLHLCESDLVDLLHFLFEVENAEHLDY
jgi:hypothetical protein